MRSNPAVIELSLPWFDVLETQNLGKVVCDSKDVMPWSNGHVECIALAKHSAIKTTPDAIKKVMKYIYITGRDIERARSTGGKALQDIIQIIRKFIPLHTQEAFRVSLNSELPVINYHHLNIDKPSLVLTRRYTLDGDILKAPIDIVTFADEQLYIDLNLSE